MTSTLNFFESLTKLTLTPVTIRRIFLLLTRLHYSTPDNYGPLKDKLSPFVWSAAKAKSTMHIDYDYNYDPSALDERPAIFVGIDDIEYRKVVIANSGNPTESRSGQYYTKTGGTKIILRHISKSPDEVLALGDLSSQFFMGITPMIRDTLSNRILEYEVVGLKSSRPFEKTSQQADQHFMSDLIIAFSYNATWLVEFESHRIKTYSFQQCLAEFVKK
jgi:hypothetical protein